MSLDRIYLYIIIHILCAIILDIYKCVLHSPHPLGDIFVKNLYFYENRIFGDELTIRSKYTNLLHCNYKANPTCSNVIK